MRATALPAALTLIFIGGTALANASAEDANSFVPAREWYPVQKVYSVALSRSGFFYLGSDEGIVRIDGQHAAPWGGGPRPRSFVVDALAVQVDDTPMDGDVLWAAYRDHGIWRIDKHTAQPILAAQAFNRARVTALSVAPDGALWVGTTHGLWGYRGGDLQRSAIHEPITAIEADGKARVWVGTEAGLHVVVAGNRPIPIAGVSGVVSLALDESLGVLWVADSKRAISQVELDGNRVTQVLPPTGVDDPPVALTRAVEGGVWASYRRHCKRISAERQAVPLPENRCTEATAMVEDPLAGLWVAGPWGKVVLLRRRPSHRVATEAGPSPPVAFAVTVDAEGALWTSVAGGILHLEDRGVVFLRNGEDVPWWCSRSLFPRNDGSLLVATCDAGLFVLEKGTSKSRRLSLAPDGLSKEALAGVFESQNGTIWTSTLDGRLFHGHEGAFSAAGWRLPACDFTKGMDPSDCTSTVIAFAETPGGVVWFGTRGAGVFRYSSQTGEISEVSEGLSGKRILALHADAQGRLWMGTPDAGLYLWQGGRFRSIAFEVPPRSILGLTHDSEGNLWFSHETGVSRTKIEHVLQYLENARAPVTRYTHGALDGFAGVRIVQEYPPPLAFWRSDQLAVPTSQGLMLLDTASSRASLRVGDAQLDRMEVNGVATQPTPIIDLGLGRTRVSSLKLQFAVAFAGDRQNLRVRYRMGGVDDSWRIDDGSLSVMYSELPAGPLSLDVQVYRAGHEQEARTHTYRFTFKGLFQRPMAWALAIVGLLGLGVLTVWLRERWIQARFAGILHERNNVAREVHDTIAQYFTALSLQLQRLRARIAQTEVEQALQATDEASEIVERCRLEVRHVIRGLRSPRLPSQTSLTSGIEDLVSQLRVLDLAEIRVEVDGTEQPLPAVPKRHLGRLVQEALTNAVAHGHADSIVVTMRWRESALQIEIVDDGVGFDVAHVDPESLLHFGLRGMKERAQLLNASLDIRSQPNQGTRVAIEFDWSKASNQRGGVS